ncbi:hypothetical protein [Ekhidna sp.]
MKKLFLIFTLISSLASAQELDSLALDTLALDTLEKPLPPYYGGIFFEVKGSLEPSTPEKNILSGYGVGIQYKKWIIGFNRFDTQGKVEALVIFPNIFELKYRYGGPFIAFSAIETSSLSIIFRAGYYQGDMTWQRKEDEEAFLRDEFTLLKGAIIGEFSRFRYAKPYISIGLQEMKDLDLASVENEDFSGLFFAVGLRIGYFNQ